MARVLVVEDDRDVLRAVVMNLRASGHEVTGCDNGPDALERHAGAIIEGNPYAAVVLDGVLTSEMSGFKVAEEIRRGGDEDIQIIFLTGDDAEMGQIRAKACGAAGYFKKPDGLDDVKAILAT